MRLRGDSLQILKSALAGITLKTTRKSIINYTTILVLHHAHPNKSDF